MKNSQGDFAPMHIDEQLEQPETLLSPADTQLVYDLQAMLEQEKQAWLEQGWARLLSRRADADQSSAVLELSTYRHNKRLSTTPDHNTPVIALKTTPKQRLTRLLNLVASALVCITLVSSLAFVFTATRNHVLSTRVGSHGTTPSTAAIPTNTSRPNPSVCQDNSYPIEEMLCTKGEEITLNITRSVTFNSLDAQGHINDSHTILLTFLRAYADPAQFLLTYRIDQAGINWGGLVTLSTSQGNLDAFSLINQGIHKGLYVQSFNMSNLPLNLTQLQVNTVVTAFGAAIPLNFTLPSHTTHKIVPIKQVVTTNGYVWKLDHLLLTESATDLFYTYTSQFTPFNGLSVDMDIQTLTINGQKQTISGGHTSSFSASSTGGSGMASLSQTLLHQPGMWTMTLAFTQVNASSTAYVISSPLITATISFTVPA